MLVKILSLVLFLDKFALIFGKLTMLSSSVEWLNNLVAECFL